MRLGLFIGTTILVSLSMLIPSNHDIFKVLDVNELTVYTTNKMEEYNSVLNGNGYTFSCSIEEFKSLHCNFEGISFKTNFSPCEVINKLNLKIQSRQIIPQEDNNIEIYYCYLENSTNGFIVIKNKKVNLQIAFDGKNTILGLPLILGSY